MCVGLLKGPCCLLVHSKVDGRETQVLKMLCKGNMEQISRRELQEKSTKVYNRAQFQQECLMPMKILMTKMLIWESKRNYKLLKARVVC